VLKTKLPGATQKLAQIEQLPVYSETEEVAKILKEMLDDLATRLSVIDEMDAQAQKLVDDTFAKMVEWEKKLVALGNGESPLSLCAYTQTRMPFVMLVKRAVVLDMEDSLSLGRRPW
jgi:hypothetical protein